MFGKTTKRFCQEKIPCRAYRQRLFLELRNISIPAFLHGPFLNQSPVPAARGYP
jgi:hypothetical protein